MSTGEERNHGSVPAPGSMNDDHLVRDIITQTIKACGLSRAQIADQMSYLLGEKVTERMISSYTSEAMEKHRWPLHFSRAFCEVTRNWKLIRCVAELVGFTVIEGDDVNILELGRHYLTRKKADEAVAALELALKKRN
jgi:hypothetical protein